MTGIRKASQPIRGFRKQDIESHRPLSPDLAFHIRRNPHGNLDLVKFDCTKAGDFVRDDLKSRQVFMGIDQLCFSNRITERPDHFHAHREEAIFHMEPLDVRRLLPSAGLKPGNFIVKNLLPGSL